MSSFQQGMLLFLFLEYSEAKKQCWYFEGVHPTHYICRSYEDCCGSRCCVRSLSIQRLWFLLMMGVLFCCWAGFFIRRRMYPPPLVDETTYNVSFTRPPNSSIPAIWHKVRIHSGQSRRQKESSSQEWPIMQIQKE